MTDSPNSSAAGHTHDDHTLEILQRLRKHFTSAESEHGSEGLKLLDELEMEWHSETSIEGDDKLHTALGHAERSLQQAARREEDDLFHRAMHSLEAAIVDLETTLPAAARLLKRMAGLITNIGL